MTAILTYSVSDGTSLTEHEIPITLIHGLGGATITGTGMNELIEGSSYADVLSGGGGTDTIVGGLGDDTIQFTSAQLAGNTDHVNGGSGSDTLLLTDTTAPVAIADADLHNVISVETFKAVTSGDITYTLGTNAADDVFLAGENTLTLDLSASTGKLTLDASAFKTTDPNNGGAEVDPTLKVLLGIDGNDVLTGGPGANIYEFNAKPIDGNDTITNFDHTKDSITVSASAFGGGLTAGMDTTGIFEASAGNAFTSPADRFHFDTTGGTLYYSADGTSTKSRSRTSPTA